MPTVRRTITIAGVGATSGGGGGGGSAGQFGYHIITPSGGNAAIDLNNGFIQRLVLNASAVNFTAPIWTGGSIVAGLKLWLFVDQDATGGRIPPTFDSGAGGFSTDCPAQQLDGTPDTRSLYQLTYHGSIWCLDFGPISTGMAIS